MHIDSSNFALKTNLASLKTEVDKLDIEKLAPVPVELNKLSDVVKNNVVKKTVYNKLAVKINNIDTSDFVLKTKYQTNKTELEKKIPDLTDPVKKTKVTDLQNKIPDVSSLATKTALTAVGNKIPDASSLVKKPIYDTKISELEKKLTAHNHDKYITAPEFNTMAASVFNARLSQANLITKTDFDTKLSSLNRKITANKSKHLLVENELKKMKTFDSGYFRGKRQFEEYGTQNYLVFQPIYRYFEIIACVDNDNKISYWQSEGLSDERISSVTVSNYSVTPDLNYYGTRIRAGFYGGCLKQEKVTFNQGKVVNIYIVYETVRIVNLSKHSSNDNYPTLENALFGPVSLTKNADIDKYKYSGYGIEFDRKGSFSFPGAGLGKNVIIFGVDMSSSTNIDNRKKDILIFVKGSTQELEHTLSVEKCI